MRAPLGLLLSALLLAPVPGAAVAAPAAHEPDRVLVKFVADSPGARTWGGGALERLAIAVLDVPAGTAAGGYAAAWREHPDVHWSQPEIAGYEPAEADPDFDRLWGLHNTGQALPDRGPATGVVDVDIDAPEAWLTLTGSTETVVAVIDTGVDVTHPDLYERIWLNAGELPDPPSDDGDGVLTVRDFAGGTDHNLNGYVDADDLRIEHGQDGVDDDGNGFVDDVYGWDFARDSCPGGPCVNGNDLRVGPICAYEHGTHVAGTIAATGDNGVGVVGVAPGVRIMPLKFLDCTGSEVDAARALLYADAQGVTIANNSWRGQFTQVLYDAIEATNLVYLAAAGNGATDIDIAPSYPAAYDLPNILSVAAITKTGARASFSNWGAVNVDLAAPGTETWSTLPDASYAYFQGTSMATPHVSGIAALLQSLDPSITTARSVEVIRCAVTPIASMQGITTTGGLANAADSLDMLGRAGPPVLGVTVAPGRIDLAWTHPAHPGTAPRTGYRLTVEPGGIVRDLPAGATATAVTGLPDGVTHEVRLWARTAVADGCAARVAATPAGPPTAAPAGVGATPSLGELDIVWDAVTEDGGSPITGYVVTATPPSGPASVRQADGAARSSLLTGLDDGTAYNVTVAAGNQHGTGPASDPIVATTPDGPPSAPRAVSAEARDEAIAVSWEPPDGDGGSPVTGYRVVVEPASPTATVATTVEVAAPATSVTVAGLINDTAYGVSVTTITAIGESPPATLVGTVTPRAVPGAPEALAVLAGNGRAVLTWEAPERGGDRVTGYTVRVSPRGQSLTTTGTGADLGDLVNGTLYTAEVVAHSDVGVSEGAKIFVEPVPPSLERLAGADRYATAADIARELAPDGAPTAYLATGEAFADALAAGATAALSAAPILLARRDELPAVTANEIARLGVQRVVVVGGPAAISDAVLDTVAALVPSATVERVSGEDRYATAAALSASTYASGHAVAYMASGEDFPDALALGAATGTGPGPILLVRATALPTETADELARLKPGRVILAGGREAVSDDVVAAIAAAAGVPVTRIAGATRYDTAAAIANTLFPPDVAAVYLATGRDFPDAVAGAAAAAVARVPVLLVPDDGTMPERVSAQLARLRPNRVVVLGGEDAVTDVIARIALGAAG